MSPPPTESNGEHQPESTPAETRDDRASMEELRELILGAEKREIKVIREHLADTSVRAREVAEVLPEAFLIRAAKDDRIAEALSPTIANTLRTSIRRDSKALGDALFPVMGPAIRKSITNTLWGMIESLNQMLEHSVSVQGLKWRLEAARTRKKLCRSRPAAHPCLPGGTSSAHHDRVRGTAPTCGGQRSLHGGPRPGVGDAHGHSGFCPGLFRRIG